MKKVRAMGGVRWHFVLFIFGLAFAQAGCGGGDSSALALRSGASLAPETRTIQVAQPAADDAVALPASEPVPVSERSMAVTDRALATKATGSHVSVYRFYNPTTLAHFYTSSEAEKNTVLLNMPFFSYDGAVFTAAGGAAAGLSPVYRFLNRQTGVHFYTISETEKDDILARLPQFQLDGPAYFASKIPGPGFIPVHRFYQPGKGYHFYTASEEEKNHVQTNLGQTYRYEGIGYYVLSDVPRSDKLPHSGVTGTQCYQVGSDALGNCVLRSASNLSPQQDGHRSQIRPMSYSMVGVYPISSCVMDNVTGLVWEGKTASGERSVANTYSNFGDGRVGDASAYVARVNQLALCGFTDWRLPTAGELLGLMDFGQIGNRLNPAWFGVTANTYWSSSPVEPWYNKAVHFEGGAIATIYINGNSHNSQLAVRLVRGASFTGARFAVGTAAYPGDAANNVINDLKTGLQWRRCEEGRRWIGTRCQGLMYVFAHQDALLWAQTMPGWRLPNVKELHSLVPESGTYAMDPQAFPGAESWGYWTSTPNTAAPNRSLQVDFGAPPYIDLATWSRDAPPDFGGGVRLVRLLQ